MAKYRMIGTTDDVVDCAKCGKPDLRATVVLELLDAEGNSEGITYFGSTCAARALATRGIRISAAKVRSEADAAQRQREAMARHCAANLDFYGIAIEETLTEDRIAEILPKWRSVNTITGGRLRPLDEARAMFLDCVARNQAAVKAVRPSAAAA